MFLTCREPAGSVTVPSPNWLFPQPGAEIIGSTVGLRKGMVFLKAGVRVKVQVEVPCIYHTAKCSQLATSCGCGLSCAVASEVVSLA
jgi:hypothetical protein